MNLLRQWIKALYNFLVGDLRILLGTLGALVIVTLLARVLPGGSGILFFVLLAITLTLSLRYELAP